MEKYEWYLIKVQPKLEKKMIERILFISKIKKMKINSLTPLFKDSNSGFILCKCIMDEKLTNNLRKIKGLNFSNRLESNENENIQIPSPIFTTNDKEEKIMLQGLFKKIKFNTWKKKREKELEYKKNEKILVSKGIFSGFEGKIKEVKRKNLIIEINNLGIISDLKVNKKDCLKN